MMLVYLTGAIMKSNSRFNARSVYSLCGIAMLGGVMFDYSTGVISGTVDSIQAHFHLAPTQTGWVVSSMFVGCIIGSLIAGNLAARLGRKLVLLPRHSGFGNFGCWLNVC